MRSPRLVVPLLAALLLGGCAPPIPAAPRATGTPEVTSQPAGAATAVITVAAPDLSFSDVVTRRGQEVGEWNIYGIVKNETATSIGDVRLRVTASGAEGRRLEADDVPLLLSVVPPGGQAPFAASLSSPAEPREVQVESVSGAVAVSEAPRLVVQDLSSVGTAKGLEVLGSVVNAGSEPLRVRDAVLVARDVQKGILGVSRAQVASPALKPGEASPLAALMAAVPKGAGLELFSAITAESLPELKLEVLGKPVVERTAQGKWFVIATLRNTDMFARWPAFAVVLRSGERLLGMQTFRPPTPLQAGELLSFAADDFPGLAARLAAADPADLRAEVLFDPFESARSQTDPVLLGLEVNGYEVIGSSVFLRGTVQNRNPSAVREATVYVVLRSTEGELQTAGWAATASEMPAGAQSTFTFSLPLPAGIDPAMSEYDVQAYGMPAGGR